MYLPLKEGVAGLDRDQFEKLKQLTLEARQLSYAPYSKFRVGCCLVAEGDLYYTGANVENASYGGAICAERTTIVKAVTSGCPESADGTKWVCLAIAGDSLETCISPCGICRQFIREFAADDFPVVMFNGDGSQFLVRTLRELLPLSFGPGDLAF
ncbi:hypothetical protein HG536_0C00640 [Torulaspora globosa]|uniref:Cytidine deaminase n=1 Tax=Torulaspora globosa TaxID=48254 RepID=A0A7G3ZEG1_9SACH|nr:uncharacterized protein HG536_0C00640 [Torulaspora globosa]QLL31897.1 hypothetical protein HG536_0C00640 [Torulaspora globosa]